MEDIHQIFTEFKREFPAIHEKNEALGQLIHENAGPLDTKTRWLIKLGISAAGGHHRALVTHIHAAREAGATEEEIRHTLLLLIPTCGFPAFMEAYQAYKGC
ncbi:MAG: carboxymuconolactone decarboxylase family protein [Actinobacteria bacterium]|nr:carboxymuconolactone decarboxylase family protein [Actinomycetota bacterium]